MQINLFLIDEYLFNPNQRLYWGYLFSAGILSVVYLWWQKQSISLDSIKHRIKQYWLHPQAILDYQYFVVVWLIKTYLLIPLLLSAKAVALVVFNALTYLHSPWVLTLPDWIVSVIYTMMIFFVGEFSRYWLHRWLHTVPLLWQFHKVHHSATLLNPITFYRVHPIENLLFGLRYSVSAGVVTGFCLWIFSTQLDIIMIFGANALVALLTLIGGNLRHSHIYLCYPKWLEKYFMSPAQHQLHHTAGCANKNYGGYLAIFDWWYDTQAFSKDYSQPKIFGFSEKMTKNYRHVSKLLLQPFIDCGVWYAKKQHQPKTYYHNNSR